MFPSIFDPANTEAMLTRLEGLSADTTPEWGKMNTGQMLAHLNVAYDITNGKIPASYNFFMRFMMKLFVKPIVVGRKPYAKNGQTAPVFIIEGERDFSAEKAKLIANMRATEAEGPAAYEGRESPSFGKLSSQEWSNMYWKHMNHHFTQFGV